MWGAAKNHFGERATRLAEFFLVSEFGFEDLIKAHKSDGGKRFELLLWGKNGKSMARGSGSDRNADPRRPGRAGGKHFGIERWIAAFGPAWDTVFEAQSPPASALRAA